MPERMIGAARIDEMFSEDFFKTPFWQMWRTMFAFQNWHSAIEMKRYVPALHSGIPSPAHR